MNEQGGEWRDDPDVPGRLRYWSGSQWTRHISVDGEQTEEPYLGGAPRWQYGIVDIGGLFAKNAMGSAFSFLGQHGWELVTVYDKSSNWIGNMEVGFMLFKRPVPPGQQLPEDRWCVQIRPDGSVSQVMPPKGLRENQ